MDRVRSGRDSGHVSPPKGRNVSVDGELPSVTLQNVCSRPRPTGHVIVFANEKGGVGKSTLAFHCSVALCHAGAKVAVVDLDRRQQSLARALENRATTARCLQTDIPSPQHLVLQQQNGAQLSQEIARIGWECDFVVIDVAGHDSSIARFAIAMADTLVTPVNSSFVDLDLLGKFDPVTGKLKGEGHFARLVKELREERLRYGLPPSDWIVMKNRVRGAEKRQQMRIEGALQHLAPKAGFRISQGLSERVVYRELFPFGLTHLDLKLIPGLAKMQAKTEREVTRLISDLALPEIARTEKPVKAGTKAIVGHDLAQAFSATLHAHINPEDPLLIQETA